MTAHPPLTHIPPFLHRIWIPGSPPMPDQFAQYGKEWDRLHPQWPYHFEWTDAFPPMRNQALYDDAPNLTSDFLRFRADIARLEILYHFGGLYVDTDIRPLKPFDKFLPDGCFLGASPNSPADTPLLTNAIIGAYSEHPFIDLCIDELPKSVTQFSGRHISYQTGPRLISRCYDLWERENRTPRVMVYPAKIFYPQSTAERDRGDPPDLSTAYSHHHWNTTAVKRGVGYE